MEFGVAYLKEAKGISHWILRVLRNPSKLRKRSLTDLLEPVEYSWRDIPSIDRSTIISLSHAFTKLLLTQPRRDDHRSAIVG